MVKRYEIIGHDWYTSEESTGTYVTHADYRALEELRASDAECLSKVNELLQAENYDLKEELAALRARSG